MKSERRPRETNQQLIRRFNRDVLLDGKLQEFKDRQFNVKPLSRNMRRANSVRVAKLIAEHQRY